MSRPHYLFDGREDAEWTLILAHGAGQGMDSEFMSFIAAKVAALGDELGGVRVVRFEFPYMRRIQETGKRRGPDRADVLQACWKEVFTRYSAEEDGARRVVIGGKSLGGRVASMVADECGATGLVCLGYPFHPPGKPERLRTEHLQTLNTPTLICQGERDTFGNREEVRRYSLSPAIQMQWLTDGDHGFKPRKRSGLSSEDNWGQAAQAIATFLGQLR